MFRKCCSCLQGVACLEDVRPRTELPVGFYTGEVHQVGEDMVLLGLSSSITTEQELVYMLQRRNYPAAKPGDLVYVLKLEESEIVTIPAGIAKDELMCQVLSISSSYAVLKETDSGSVYVFPYVNFHLKDPLQYISKPACLLRTSGQHMYDVIIEEAKSPKVSFSPRLNNSDSAVIEEHSRSRRGSLRPAELPMQNSAKLPTKFASLEENVFAQRVESEPALDTGRQNLSFTNPFVIKEEDQSSSFLTFEGDSGGELINISGLEAPEPAHGDYIQPQASTRTSAQPLTRVMMSPYGGLEAGKRTVVAVPGLVGRDRLPLQLLRQPGLHDKQIETIGTRAVAWRTFDPAAGSFFRSVGVAWLEHLARVTTSVLELETLLQSMRAGEPAGFHEIPDFQEACKTAIETVESIRGLKDFNRMTAIVHLQTIFQQGETVTQLERYIRMICVNYMTGLAGTSDLSPSVLNTMRRQAAEIEQAGMDFSGVVYTAVAETLSIAVCLISIEEGVANIEEFHPDLSEKQTPEVCLLRVQDHFHLLYSRETQAVDGYDLDTHCFEVLEASGDQSTASFKA